MVPISSSAGGGSKMSEDILVRCSGRVSGTVVYVKWAVISSFQCQLHVYNRIPTWGGGGGGGVEGVDIDIVMQAWSKSIFTHRHANVCLDFDVGDKSSNPLPNCAR